MKTLTDAKSDQRSVCVIHSGTNRATAGFYLCSGLDVSKEVISETGFGYRSQSVKPDVLEFR